MGLIRSVVAMFGTPRKTARLIVGSVLVFSTAGCASLKYDPPAKVKFYYDCCSPSLQPDAKMGCKVAKNYPNDTIVDENGDKHIFVWSECQPGKERWRRWE